MAELNRVPVFQSFPNVYSRYEYTKSDKERAENVCSLIRTQLYPESALVRIDYQPSIDGFVGVYVSCTKYPVNAFTLRNILSSDVDIFANSMIVLLPQHDPLEKLQFLIPKLERIKRTTLLPFPWSTGYCIQTKENISTRTLSKRDFGEQLLLNTYELRFPCIALKKRMCRQTLFLAIIVFLVFWMCVCTVALLYY